MTLVMLLMMVLVTIALFLRFSIPEPTKPIPTQRYLTSRILNGLDEVRDPELAMAILIRSEKAKVIRCVDL